MPDLTGLSPEEKELALQEAEDRRLMQQIKQRELERKRKAEELRLKKAGSCQVNPGNASAGELRWEYMGMVCDSN